MPAKHVHLTWYILADGTQADPDDCSPGADGVLRHKNGMAVALRDNGVPMTIGVAAETGKNALAVELGEEGVAEAEQMAKAEAAAPVDVPAAEVGHTDIDPATGKPDDEGDGTSDEAKDLKPAPAKRYKTRETKGR